MVKVSKYQLVIWSILIHNKNERICRVCGLKYDNNEVRDEFGEATFNICNCCGVEFGYEDINIKYQNYWINELKEEWFSKKYKPNNWDIFEQLRRGQELLEIVNKNKGL